MSIEKEPLTSKEFDKILQAATRTSEEARKVVLLFRYTGMHVSILANPLRYRLRVEDNEIVWDRTKKKGKIAYTSVPISQHLDFNVNEFIMDIKIENEGNLANISTSSLRAVAKKLVFPMFLQ